ncbi:C2 domain [Dillenia turbinata]|uniref:C2 domain n=1 Tax=Dillenia turbinata TaxID=194707 RepID=A0AAN8VNT9_9MAGN
MTQVKCRIVQITVMDARNLEAVLTESEMKVYAKISINGNPKTVKRTPVDKKGKRWPAWNFSIEYVLSENAVTKDVYIGEVSVQMKDLFDQANGRGNATVVSYDVRRGSQLSQGEIKFSCAFGNVKTIKKPGAWKKWADTAINMGIQVASFLSSGTPVPIRVKVFV